jgi:hypothetical protein
MPSAGVVLVDPVVGFIASLVNRLLPSLGALCT